MRADGQPPLVFMGQTEEFKMMSRPNRMVYTPITRGHKPTASQESNTLSTMSEVSCTTTLSSTTDGETDRDDRLEDFKEEQEQSMGWRSGSEETIDTVVAAVITKQAPAGDCTRLGSGNSDYGSYCNTPTSPALASDIQNAPLIQTSDEEEEQVGGVSGEKSSNPLDHVKITIPGEVQKPDKIPQEPLKTLLAGLFLGTGFLVTSLSLAFTHDRHPRIEPLPDVVLDSISYQSWGLDVSEYLLMISTLSAILVVILHKHRLIILRRIWLLLGILYYYRALTFFVTVLPKADEEYECAPISNQTSAMDYMRRVITISSGGGLSINGNHIYCGDYIFSGHTMTLTMGYLAIKQYSPRRFVLLHWVSFLTSLCGVIFLLLARGHYTIDVILAYYVTTRLWWSYHTVANNNTLRTAGDHNLIANECWWHPFRWFECNTKGPLPRRYNVPLPKVIKRFFVRKMSVLRRDNSVSGDRFSS